MVVNPIGTGKGLNRVDGTPLVSFRCDRSSENNHTIADADRDALKGRVSRELLLDFALEVLVTVLSYSLRSRLAWSSRYVRLVRHGLCRLLRKKNSLPLPQE
jgi:hypothetical protein